MLFNLNLLKKQNKMNNLFEIRYSPRALSDKEIDNSIIEDIFAIAGSSPSSFNSQPWRFLILDKSNVLYNKVLSTMSNFNQGWAKNASKLIVTLARNKYEHNGKNYKHSFYDLGQSVAYMTLRALEHGIYIRQMGGFDSEKLTELLNVDSWKCK